MSSKDRPEPLVPSSTKDPDPSHEQAERVRVCGLKVDYLDRPLGLDNHRPYLSWRLESAARNVRQSAYRILVASSEDALRAGCGDLWDSGKVSARRCFSVPYEGRELVSRQRCWWQVQVWNERGEPSRPSSVSWWEMGLLEPGDWKAQWLAVEDAVERADREAGFHWIWGQKCNEARPRKFRCKFSLPLCARGGQFFVAINDSLSAISGIWIDGRAIAHRNSEARGTQWLQLPPLEAGEHLLAAEIVPVVPSIFMSKSAAQAYGFAWFARLTLHNDDILRIASSSNGTTGFVSDPGWLTCVYDDAAWEVARTVPAPTEGYHPWPAAPAMYLRREFSVRKPLLQARLYATALGCYEARLNGQRIGDALLTPEISQFDKRVLYRVYDVTALLVPKKNVTGFVVGDGFYASSDGRYAWLPPPRRVLAQLELTYTDGSREVVVTGPDWRTAPSPIQASEMKSGEVYDARLEQPGWDTAQFDDAHWQLAHLAEAPSCRLAANTSPPIRVTEVLKPQKVTQLRDGVCVFDFGQHFAGWCRLHARGASGSLLELKFAELLTGSGEVCESMFSMGHLKRDVFILKGAPCEETFEPHFTYRGFRYVQVIGTVDSLSIEGCFVHSDLELTGRLRVDNQQIQRIWSNTVRTQRSNFVGIPTDCPSREQRGYMADVAIFWDAASFNMDINAFSARQMDNVADAQAADGVLPICAPLSRFMLDWLPSGNTPAWSDGSVIVPWVVWQRYGDLSIIARHWEAMNRYLESIARDNPDYIWCNARGNDLGDWIAVDHTKHSSNIFSPTTPGELIGTAYWAYSVSLLAQMAQALGRGQDADRLQALAQRIRRAFNSAFVRPDGSVGSGSQTGYVLALKFQLLPESLRQLAVSHLVADIRWRGVALSTGILGTQFILDVLTDMGFADLAYSLLLRSEYPSWGHMIRNDATTIWENWSGAVEDAGPLSRNHFALGSVCGFLFRRIAGIDAAAPGFETIRIRPVLDGRVRRGGADYDSIMGRISTDWEMNIDVGFTLDVTVPPNATAHVHLPAPSGSLIEEGGEAVARRKDMRLVQHIDGEALIEVGSGSYRFTVSLPGS